MNDPTDSYNARHEEDVAQQKQFDDKELADAVVALGVGRKNGEHYVPPDQDFHYVIAFNAFVRDWRVAGACLEQWPTTINVEHLQLGLDEMLRRPVAICEAFVQSQSTGNSRNE